MKRTAFYFTVLFLLLGISGMAQTVSFSGKNANLETIFTVIEKQTGYSVIYNKKLLRDARPVSITANKILLKEFLELLFKNQSLKYEINNRSIFVTKKTTANTDIDAVEDGTGLINISGIVRDGMKKPLAGATINVKGKNRSVFSDNDGNFKITASRGGTLIISYIGFEDKEIRINNESSVSVILTKKIEALDTSNIVMYSTGYQKIPKERATGSFSFVDNKTLQQQVSSDILSRLEGTIPGLRMPASNSFRGAANALLIRGEASFNNTAPLIVLDNFIYTGSLAYINPNDINSITVLKDAAAASIWGAQAGNGVIVITTKGGAYNKKSEIQININTSISQKEQLFSRPVISVAEFVELERLNFARGLTNSVENGLAKQSLSPVEELLVAKRDGKMSGEDVETQIDALANRPHIWNDYLKYLHRNPVTQRYGLNFSGGGHNYTYYLSGGYDRALAETKNNENGRKTISIKNAFKPLKGLEINIAASYVNDRTFKTTLNKNNYPYERLVDDNGLPANVVYGGFNRSGKRESFIDQAEAKGLLDWRYRPLEEAKNRNDVDENSSYLLNAAVSYSPIDAVNIQLMYQNQTVKGLNRNVTSTDMYSFRDLYNTYTDFNGLGKMVNPIPYGGIVASTITSDKSQSARVQLNFNKIWKGIHAVTGLVAAELNEAISFSGTSTQYGFTEQGLTFKQVDYVNPYKSFVTGNNIYIPYTASESQKINRYLSYFGNASYSYKNKYTITGSLRKDGANLFGVKTNQKWNPFFSTGISWDVSREQFWQSTFIPNLKLRATYGYTGTVQATNSYLVVSYAGPSSLTRLNTGYVRTPPNPDLKWEEQKNINIGLDFVLRNRVISGTIEYFVRHGLDLIFNVPLDPTTGFWTGSNLYSVKKNHASMLSKGVDLQLKFLILAGKLTWNSTFNMAYSKSVVKKVAGMSTLSSYLFGSAVVENEEYKILYSYKWGGLSPMDGSPIGYLNGIPTNNYSLLTTQTTPGDLIKHGSATPRFHGALLNSFSYKALSFNFSLLYQLGYYFRRNSYSYRSNMNTSIHRDYRYRWQKAGDEFITNVPSIPAVANSARSTIYENSEVLAERGDHIRLQYINLSYDLGSIKKFSSIFKLFEVFVNANDLGLLWKASRLDIDPMSPDITISKTISFGIRCTIK